MPAGPGVSGRGGGEVALYTPNLHTYATELGEPPSDVTRMAETEKSTRDVKRMRAVKLPRRI